MINKFSLAKALRDNADVVAAANSYTLIGFDTAYETNPNDAYVKEICLYGNDKAIGLADNSSDYLTGVYQISVYTPKTQTKWSGITVADIFAVAFARGVTVTHSGQSARMKNNYLSPMMQDDTHYIHNLTIEFSVIN